MQPVCLKRLLKHNCVKTNAKCKCDLQRRLLTLLLLRTHCVCDTLAICNLQLRDNSKRVANNASGVMERSCHSTQHATKSASAPSAPRVILAAFCNRKTRDASAPTTACFTCRSASNGWSRPTQPTPHWFPRCPSPRHCPSTRDAHVRYAPRHSRK